MYGSIPSVPSTQYNSEHDPRARNIFAKYPEYSEITA